MIIRIQFHYGYGWYISTEYPQQYPVSPLFIGEPSLFFQLYRHDFPIFILPI